MIVGACIFVFYLIWVVYFVYLSNHKGRKLESTLKEVFTYTALMALGGFIATLWIFVCGKQNKLVVGYLIALGGMFVAATIAMVICMFCGENKLETKKRLAFARLSGRRYELIMENLTLVDKCKVAYSYALAEFLTVEKQASALGMRKVHSCSYTDVQRLKDKDPKTLVKCLKLKDINNATAKMVKLRTLFRCGNDVRKAIKNLEEALKEQIDESISMCLDMNQIAFDFCEISDYDMSVIETLRLMFEYTDADSKEKKELIVAIDAIDVERMVAELESKKH